MVELTIDKIDPKDTNRLRIVKYLNDRTLADVALEDACKKENKTLDGVLNYVLQEAQKIATHGGAWVDDDVVWNWVVHYIQEDELDCEPRKEEPKETKPFDYDYWKNLANTTTAQPTKPIDTSGQLTFDF